MKTNEQLAIDALNELLSNWDGIAGMPIDGIFVMAARRVHGERGHIELRMDCGICQVLDAYLSDTCKRTMFEQYPDCFVCPYSGYKSLVFPVGGHDEYFHEEFNGGIKFNQFINPERKALAVWCRDWLVKHYDSN